MTLTPETYWSTLFGDRSAGTLVAEFGLTATGRDLSEWVGSCEAAATAAGAVGLDDIPGSWRAGLLAEIEDAIGAECARLIAGVE